MQWTSFQSKRMFTWDCRRKRETLVGQGVPYFYLARCGVCCLSSVMEETVHIARNPRMRLTTLLLLDRCGVDKRPITSGTGRMDFIFTWPAFLAPSTCDPTQRHTPSCPRSLAPIQTRDSVAPVKLTWCIKAATAASPPSVLAVASLAPSDWQWLLASAHVLRL